MFQNVLVTIDEKMDFKVKVIYKNESIHLVITGNSYINFKGLLLAGFPCENLLIFCIFLLISLIQFSLYWPISLTFRWSFNSVVPYWSVVENKGWILVYCFLSNSRFNVVLFLVSYHICIFKKLTHRNEKLSLKLKKR